LEAPRAAARFIDREAERDIDLRRVAIIYCLNKIIL